MCSIWGNSPLERGNGEDANCIVRAKTFQSALALASVHLSCYRAWWHGRIDNVIELGTDNSSDEEAIICRRFVMSAYTVKEHRHWMREVDENDKPYWIYFAPDNDNREHCPELPYDWDEDHPPPTAGRDLLARLAAAEEARDENAKAAIEAVRFATGEMSKEIDRLAAERDEWKLVAESAYRIMESRHA